MRHAMLSAVFTLAVATSFVAAIAAPPELYVPVEHPGAPEDLGVRGFVTDYELMADPSAPRLPTGPDVEVQELQDAYPSTNWPPSMRK